MDNPALSVESGVDFHSFGSDYVTTAVGADALLAPTIRETRTQVAARAQAQSYVVQDDDTLGQIAEKFSLNLTTILWSNNLTFRSTIRPGQALTIPPVDGVSYAVRSGDTLLAIARRYSANTEEIVRFNKLDPDETLQIGQALMIPNGQPPAPAAPSRSASFSQIFSAPTPATGGERGSATGTGEWVWPTDWRVITQYFTWRHTGIDIDGDYTTNSYAAADGEVVYAGWRRGYGLTVEIDHGNGIMTRYGHHSSLYVKAGDIVSAGQAIARTGTTGRSTGTHLHFEVIVNGRFKNPLEYVR
jgi:LysM repeat protein